jgi:hypothetical protein
MCGARGKTEEKNGGRLKTWLSYNYGADIKTPLRTMGGVRSGRGQPSYKFFATTRDFIEPDRKLMPAPSNFKKDIALAFLKAT